VGEQAARERLDTALHHRSAVQAVGQDECAHCKLLPAARLLGRAACAAARLMLGDSGGPERSGLRREQRVHVGRARRGGVEAAGVAAAQQQQRRLGVLPAAHVQHARRRGARGRAAGAAARPALEEGAKVGAGLRFGGGGDYRGSGTGIGAGHALDAEWAEVVGAGAEEPAAGAHRPAGCRCRPRPHGAPRPPSAPLSAPGGAPAGARPLGGRRSHGRRPQPPRPRPARRRRRDRGPPRGRRPRPARVAAREPRHRRRPGPASAQPGRGLAPSPPARAPRGGRQPGREARVRLSVPRISVRHDSGRRGGGVGGARCPPPAGAGRAPGGTAGGRARAAPRRAACAAARGSGDPGGRRAAVARLPPSREGSRWQCSPKLTSPKSPAALAALQGPGERTPWGAGRAAGSKPLSLPALEHKSWCERSVFTHPNLAERPASSAQSLGSQRGAMAGGSLSTGNPGGRAHQYARGRLTGAVLLAGFVGACTGLVFG
jgi:hypothetical protein